MAQLSTAGPYVEGEAARRHFDRWTGAYSRSQLLASLQRKALSELDLRHEDRVLDVACGAGRLVRAIAPRVERVAGVDLSPGMIEEARRRTGEEARAAADRIDFAVGPSDSLPFADGEFTAVITTTAFHHFPDAAGSVREMARVLAPGGRVVIGDAIRDTLPARFGDAVLRRFERGHVGLQDLAGLERLLRDAAIQPTRARRVWFGLYAFVVGEKTVASRVRTVT
jgi:ubiquinone/menaquinone biosynthesis C-methylase UbiE